MIFPLNPQTLTSIRQAYTRRLKSAPAVRASCRKITESLRPCKSALEIFKSAAEIYTSVRKNPSLFARFIQHNLNIRVESASGVLSEGYAQFPADEPKHLMSQALIKRVSVHVPDISGLKRESMAGRITESGGRRAFGTQKIRVELMDDEHSQIEFMDSGRIISVLPLNFPKTTGSALLTPLGLEKSTEFGFGFIYEYREEGSFSQLSILEARAYSALFTRQIAERVVANPDGIAD